MMGEDAACLIFSISGQLAAILVKLLNLDKLC